MKKQVLLFLAITFAGIATMAQPFKKPQSFKLGNSLKKLEQLKSSSKENPTAANEFTWDTDLNSWVPIYNYSYIYDQNELVESIAYNPFGVQEARTVYTYDGKNLVEQLVQFWVMGAWTNSYRLLLQYDSNSELVKEEMQDWINDEWQITYGLSRSVNILNADTTVIVDSMWGGTAYEAVQKTENIYNGPSKNLSEMILYMPNGSGNDWFEAYKEVYLYDSNNNISDLIKMNWNGMDWQNFMKQTEYSFDSLTYAVTGYITQNWDNTSNLWLDYSFDTLEYLEYKSFVNTSYYLFNQNRIPNTRALYFNDSLMNQIVARYDTWDQTIGDWVASIHNENAYIYTEDSLIKEKVDLALNQNYELDSMSKMVYFYNNTTGLSTEKELEFNIAPNPCADVLQVMIPGAGANETMSFEIRNISGQLLKSFKAQGPKHRLDLSELSTGMYVLKVNTSSASKSSKFIVE